LRLTIRLVWLVRWQRGRLAEFGISLFASGHDLGIDYGQRLAGFILSGVPLHHGLNAIHLESRAGLCAALYESRGLTGSDDLRARPLLRVWRRGGSHADSHEERKKQTERYARVPDDGVVTDHPRSLPVISIQRAIQVAGRKAVSARV